MSSYMYVFIYISVLACGCCLYLGDRNLLQLVGGRELVHCTEIVYFSDQMLHSTHQHNILCSHCLVHLHVCIILYIHNAILCGVHTHVHVYIEENAEGSIMKLVCMQIMAYRHRTCTFCSKPYFKLEDVNSIHIIIVTMSVRLGYTFLG